MKLRRAVVALAAVTAAGVVLAGCSAPKGSEINEKTSLSIASNSPVTSLNPLVSEQYSTYNSNPNYLMNGPGFNYYNNKPVQVKNTAFGTYKKVSSDPLTIQYTLSKNAKWSDGDPINAADILLQWASSISKYNAAKGAVNFDSVNAGSGLDAITKVPTISNGGKTVTVVFDKPYVDWEQSLLTPQLPAHIVYQEAFPDKKISNADADKAVISALQGDNTSEIAAMANAWKTKWVVDSMPTDKKLLVSSGPYVVSAFVKNQYMTLTKNPNFKAGPIPKVDSITVRFITDPTAQIQALQNGEVDIVYGQPTTDTLGAVKKAAGVKYSQTANGTYEHVDLHMNNGGPFDPAAYGGDATKALEVREAFLKTIPRQEIVDKLIKPLNPNATLDESLMFLPGSAGYQQSVQSNGMNAYDNVDIAGAKALLAKAGAPHPVIRFTYPTDNPRRVSEFQLIQQSAQQAGFTVKDAGQPGATYFQSIATSKGYDASIFGWQYTSLAFTGNQAAFQTGGSSNYQGYSNKDVDSMWQQLAYSTGSVDDNNALLAKIDKQAVADAASVAIFQFPDLTAWSAKVDNVSDNAIGYGVFWNFWEWTSQHKASATSTK